MEGGVRLGIWRLTFLEAFTIGLDVLSRRNNAARKRSILCLPAQELEVLGKTSHAEQHDIEGTLHAQEILDRMDAWSRKVWVAREYGYTWKHIGRVLGIPGDSVMLRFRRRMKILRARLSGGR